MKHLITALALTVAAAGVFAADPTPPAAMSASSKPLTKQQQKMGDCATANKGKTGDDYKSGVKSCMATKNNPLTQQEKMSACAKANKGKKGDDYKSGVKECLSASAPA
jgi:hypothetical protein